MTSRLVVALTLVMMAPAIATAEMGAPSERIEAARRLGVASDPAAVPALRRALTADPSAEVRVAVVGALASIASEEAMAAVAQARRSDPAAEVRDAARAALGEPAPTGRTFPAISFSGMMALALGWGLPAAAGLLELIIGGFMGNADAVDAGWKLLIPLAGPPWAAMTLPVPDVTFTTLGWVATAAQAMGIGLLVVGMIIEGPDAISRAEAPGARIALLPSGPTGGAGLTLAGVF